MQTGWRLIVALALGALAAGTLHAAGGAEGTATDEPLVWYVPGGSGFPYNEVEEAAVYEAFNQIVSDAVGVTVDIKAQGAFGEYRDTMPLLLASGEQMDLMWTASWSNNFLQNAYDGFLAGLDDLLEEHGQDILRDTREQLEATRVQGQIRGVWSQQIAVHNAQISANMDLVEKYGFDMGAVEVLEDLEPFLEEIRRNEPELVAFGQREAPFGLIWPYYGVMGPGVLGGVLGMRADDAQMKVFNLIASDEYRQWTELMYKWNQRGYLAKDGLTYTTDQWR